MDMASFIAEFLPRYLRQNKKPHEYRVWSGKILGPPEGQAAAPSRGAASRAGRDTCGTRWLRG